MLLESNCIWTFRQVKLKLQSKRKICDLSWISAKTTQAAVVKSSARYLRVYLYASMYFPAEGVSAVRVSSLRMKNMNEKLYTKKVTRGVRYSYRLIFVTRSWSWIIAHYMS